MPPVRRPARFSPSLSGTKPRWELPIHRGLRVGNGDRAPSEDGIRLGPVFVSRPEPGPGEMSLPGSGPVT